MSQLLVTWINSWKKIWKELELQFLHVKSHDYRTIFKKKTTSFRSFYVISDSLLLLPFYFPMMQNDLSFKVSLFHSQWARWLGLVLFWTKLHPKSFKMRPIPDFWLIWFKKDKLLKMNHSAICIIGKKAIKMCCLKSLIKL